MLRSNFFTLSALYSSDQVQISAFWSEIEQAYTGKKRHYHNLIHLEHLFSQLQPLQGELDDWEVICFSIYYHDIIYNTRKKDNEEQSALLAQKRMTQLGVPSKQIERCMHQIRCTAAHSPSDPDTNLFTDADLSILGTNPSDYISYTQQIRKEYSLYPDLLYKPGRKKVLAHFLDMDRIYKTDYFYHKLEKQCRENLQMEWETL